MVFGIEIENWSFSNNVCQILFQIAIKATCRIREFIPSMMAICSSTCRDLQQCNMTDKLLYGIEGWSHCRVFQLWISLLMQNIYFIQSGTLSFAYLKKQMVIITAKYHDVFTISTNLERSQYLKNLKQRYIYHTSHNDSL